MKKKNPFLLCSLITVLCSLFCMGCDLLNAPEVDIGDKIDAAVDWERTANISVSIANPPAWGQGALSPHAGAYGSGFKAGYAFTGEFTPDTVAFGEDQITIEGRPVGEDPGQNTNYQTYFMLLSHTVTPRGA